MDIENIDLLRAMKVPCAADESSPFLLNAKVYGIRYVGIGMADFSRAFKVVLSFFL